MSQYLKKSKNLMIEKVLLLFNWHATISRKNVHCVFVVLIASSTIWLYYQLVTNQPTIIIVNCKIAITYFE
jgi:hypothetical protein